jgi:acetoin utilization deacetylase AcuC-like enzyme
MNIPVFYSPLMAADSESPSPSSAKPVKVIESWQRQFPIEVIAPSPVTIDELARAHDRTWVESVLAGKAENGFGNKSLKVAATLTYTSGSMLSAARYVLAHGGAAAAPCSGFHHAEYRTSMGYCTFNGLMVTACALKAEGVGRVGILDLDMHYGNGTDDILEKVNQDEWCTHFTGGKNFNHAHQVPYFFSKWLPDALSKLSDCNIILYQAGADPHINDPHGGWLTTDELRQRDAVVFDAIARLNIPIVWNLAGGYQVEKDGSIPKVLEIHDNTMRECVRAYIKKA